MSDPQIATILAIIVLLVALLIFSRSGVVQRPKDRYKTSEQVLLHAKRLEVLGNKKGAINILVAGAGVLPNNDAIQSKLAELEAK